MSWEKAVQRLGDHQGEHNSFYRSKREMWGRRLYILATLKEASKHIFKIARWADILIPELLVSTASFVFYNK